MPVVYGGAAAGVGFAVNLSTSGGLLERVSVPAEPGAAVYLRFSCYLGSFETELCGTVARRTADGFAVRFDAMDALQWCLVQSLLTWRAPMWNGAAALA